MRLNILQFYIVVFSLITTQLYAVNTKPLVTSVGFSLSATIVTVNYDVTDAEQSTVTISMEVSNDNGITWNYDFGSATGDIGPSVAIGSGKTLTWTYPGAYNDQFKIRIIANDLVVDGGACADATILYGGQTYNTVQIGNQCWLKENLNIGTKVIGSLASQTNNSIIEKYCFSDLDANCATYGGLYKWSEAITYSASGGNVQGICPPGWHIPTRAEFLTLSGTVGGSAPALKSIGQGTGTNTSGFSALLAGQWWRTGYFALSLNYSYFWCSDGYFDPPSGNTYPYQMSMYKTDDLGIRIGSTSPQDGLSVRCIKN